MDGKIDSICRNKSGRITYGFIKDKNGNSYFFHKNELKNCLISQLNRGDSVEFVEKSNNSDHQKKEAVNIHALSVLPQPTPEYSDHGIHPRILLNSFNEEERKVVLALGDALYVTNGGKELTVSGQKYRYILVKPTKDYTVNFHLQREIPVIFADYKSFEPRSLDVAAEVAKTIPASLRLDRSCQIIISNDNDIEEKLGQLLRDSNLGTVVIPFSYREFLSGDMDSSSIMNRFRKYLFDADLFTSSRPIENDVFFFGRRDYALDIATKCKIGSYLCGVFGLRRSGKTSMLFAVKRQLESAGCPVVFIPCQEKLDTLDWSRSLYQISEDLRLVLNVDEEDLNSYSDYDEDGANAFGADMDLMLNNRANPVILMFDEIEAITFGVGEPSSSWYDGHSFIHFWNILRGYCTRPSSNMSIVVAGTNPMINEIPVIGNARIPNPMFQQLSSSNQGIYLKPFDIISTKTMIDTLGGYMGIIFNDSIPAKLVEDCGGHPYLIRLLCGQIYKYVREHHYSRPFVVSKAVYENARADFEKSNDAESFYLMILEILQASYPKEYETLKILATDGDQQLSRVLDTAQIVHLTGYGLIEKNGDRFAIRFDTVKRFLQGKYAFERTGLSFREQALEINTRMNDSELRLRSLVRRTLNAHKKALDPKGAVLHAMRSHSAINQNQISDAEKMNYKQLFDPTVNKACYFMVLVFIIEQNYESVFSALFDDKKETVISRFKTRFNRYRQIPAHPIDEDARNWSNDDFDTFRADMIWLENFLDENE